MDEKKWLKAAGICGVISPIIALSCIFLAIASYPTFSWTGHALSDLGTVSGITRLLFNDGLILGGAFAVIFASGFFPFLKQGKLGAAAAALFMLDAASLCAIGIFPGDARPMHYYASVAGFVLLPLSGFLITAALLLSKRKKPAIFTLASAAVAAAVWLIHWTIFPFGSGVAIPEIVAALCAGVWAAVIGIMMVRSS